MGAVLGIDGGGTKTAAVLASLEGEVLAEATRGPSNWQAVGRRSARHVLGELWEELARVGHEVVAVAWGLSGLDRPKDEVVLRAIVEEIHGSELPYVLVNDTFLILRAGTEDGVGVAVVSGTGSNCVAVGPGGRRVRIGGLGGEFGDDGSASDIGADGLRAAFRGEDGRAPATSLTARIKERFGLERLDDVIDRFIADARQRLSIGALAPLVFEESAAGDAVSRGILEHAGRELGLSARVLAARLFEAEEAFPLVMGGAVLQRGADDAMRRALVEEVRGDFPAVRPVVLEAAPVQGAVELAVDAWREVAGAEESEGRA